MGRGGEEDGWDKKPPVSIFLRPPQGIFMRPGRESLQEGAGKTLNCDRNLEITERDLEIMKSSCVCFLIECLQSSS